MAHDAQRHIRIALLQPLVQDIDIVHHRIPCAALTEIHRRSALRQRLAVAQVVVADHHDALPGQILRQRLVPVDELHHAVGELQDGPHLTLRHTAECMERPARYAGGQGEVDHLTHVILLFRLQRITAQRSWPGRRGRCSNPHTGPCQPPAHRRNRSFRRDGAF